MRKSKLENHIIAILGSFHGGCGKGVIPQECTGRPFTLKITAFISIYILKKRWTHYFHNLQDELDVLNADMNSKTDGPFFRRKFFLSKIFSSKIQKMKLVEKNCRKIFRRKFFRLNRFSPKSIFDVKMRVLSTNHRRAHTQIFTRHYPLVKGHPAHSEFLQSSASAKVFCFFISRQDW